MEVTMEGEAAYLTLVTYTEDCVPSPEELRMLIGRIFFCQHANDLSSPVVQVLYGFVVRLEL